MPVSPNNIATVRVLFHGGTEQEVSGPQFAEWLQTQPIFGSQYQIFATRFEPRYPVNLQDSVGMFVKNSELSGHDFYLTGSVSPTGNSGADFRLYDSCTILGPDLHSTLLKTKSWWE